MSSVNHTSELRDGPGLPVNPQPAWLKPKQTAGFMRVSLSYVHRLAKAGKLISRPRSGGNGMEIDPRSMPFDAQGRWRNDLLQSTMKAKSSEDNRAVSESPQLDLLPQTDWDRKVAALDCPERQRPVILGRFRAILPLVNHDYKALGYASKGSYIREIGEQCGVSGRTVQRWYVDYMQHEDLRDLTKEAPGPAATGAGSQALDASMRAFIKARWLGIEGSGLPNKNQVHSELIRYLTEKQRGCGLSYAYQFPSKTTVNRFIDELDALAQAWRQGPDAVKAALGYIDRTYTDLHSLERVDTDEWKYDCFAYDDRHPKIVRRYWLLTFYDVRAIYPLVWEAVAGNEYEVRRGIAQEDEINLLVRLILEYGVPGGLNSDRGRFRGRMFGGRPLYEKIDEVFARANGILDQLGIRRNLPREHNPRGSRLERFHRYLADCCRMVPGWIGSNVRERKMAPGDAQRAEHGRFVDGQQATTPLLSRSQLLEKTAEWMETWRGHESEGTDMRGLSPRAVFVHNTPAEGFRRISEEELAWMTAQHFQNESIEPGGSVTLPDGSRYSHPLLALMAGERREVTRLRDDHSLIKVLPARKGQEPILARRRTRVGANDPEALAQEVELQKRLRKLAASSTQPRTLEGALDREQAGQLAEAALAPPEAAEELDELPQGIELDGEIIQPRTFFED